MKEKLIKGLIGAAVAAGGLVTGLLLARNGGVNENYIDNAIEDSENEIIDGEVVEEANAEEA